MSNNYSNLPRIPLSMQSPAIAKARQNSTNPSWESARDHEIHKVEYKYQGDDRPNTHAMSIIRRNPDGKLDYEWAKNMVVDAVHTLDFPTSLLPIHRALLTVIFPEKLREMEPMQAAILTQFSGTEKATVRRMVEAHLKEEENWNAGRGGGSVEGRSKTRDGTP